MEKQNPFYFHYENENDTRESLSANSKEEFIKIFINFDDKNWLLTRLENRDFQKWLIDIGETELCNLIISIQNNSKILNKISAIKNQFLLIQYLQSTDIERAVEIVLKEYETLRSEILFYMQNRTQIILLGLTAIFTIGGLAIYPLNDFFTTENIEIPGVLNITLKRYIDGETINNKAIIPSIFIFGLIIPMISLYIIARISDSTRQIIRMSDYLANNIEKKINRLMIFKFKLDNHLYYGNNFSVTPIFLFWETWINRQRKNSNSKIDDFKIIFIVKTLFYFLGLISTIASLALSFFNFTTGNLYFNIFGFIVWLVVCFIPLLIFMVFIYCSDYCSNFSKNTKDKLTDKLQKNEHNCSAYLAKILLFIMKNY